jgi:hypothetical protein
LYVQFIGYSEPGSGTGANNLQAGGDTTFSDGELLSQDREWVSISGDANGVGGDTMGKGEVLDFNLYSTDPQGLNLPADGQASSLFFKLDGIGNNEDFIVILKLVNPDTLVTTTKAILVENQDMYKGAGSGPGIFSEIALDNNDALVIIEPNDYNAVGENWVIYGAQITITDEGITGSLINLEGDIGVASTGTQSWSDDTNDTGFKFADIGFVSTTATAQDAELSFEFNLVDADGDTTSPQMLDVNIVNGETFTGTSADETFVSGVESATMTGNGGDDIFVITDESLADLIVDYDAGDAVDLTALFDDASPDDVSDHVTYDDTDGSLTVDGTLVATVEDGVGGNPSSIDVIFDDGTDTYTDTV